MPDNKEDTKQTNTTSTLDLLNELDRCVPSEYMKRVSHIIHQRGFVLVKEDLLDDLVVNRHPRKNVRTVKTPRLLTLVQ